MRNKWYIFGAGAGVLLTVALLIALFIMGDGEEVAPTDSGPLFGDTSGSRPFDGYKSEIATYDFGTTTTQGGEVGELRLLAEVPVAGYVVVQQPADVAAEPVARYTERESGHVWNVPVARVGEKALVSLTTVPRVQEVLWSPSGSTTVYRYFDSDNKWLYSFLGTFSPAGATESSDGLSAPFSLVGDVLPDDSTAITFSPSGESLFYIVPTAEGSVAYRKELSGGAEKLIWTSPLRELAASWITDETVLVYTKPSAEVGGFAWTVNANTGTSRIVLRNTPALTAQTDPSGQYVLYSTGRDGLLSLNARDLLTGVESYINAKTLPEKCVWSTIETGAMYCGVPTTEPRSSRFPDAWYQGSITFTDAVWRIRVATGETELIAEPEKLVKAKLDMVDLQLSEKEDFLLFRDKKTGLLWSLRLPVAPPALESAPEPAATEGL